MIEAEHICYPLVEVWLGPLPVSGEVDLADAWSQWTSANGSEWAGYSVEGADDADGDSLPDLLVGAREAQPGGRVYLAKGNLSGQNSLADAWATWSGPGGSNLGVSVADLGDVDGDGQGDLLFVDWGQGNNYGGAWLVPNPAAGGQVIDDVAVPIIGPKRNGNAGDDVTAAGDVDGDGLADLLVGWGDYSEGKTLSGGAFLILGRTDLATSGDLHLADADAILVGPIADCAAGYSVAGGGDANGDGSADVLVGAPRDDSWVSAGGAAYLALGPLAGRVDLGEADVALKGEASNDQAGWDVAFAGDMDGDGWDDLLVGAWNQSNVGVEAGAAYIVTLGERY